MEENGNWRKTENGNYMGKIIWIYSFRISKVKFLNELVGFQDLFLSQQQQELIFHNQILRRIFDYPLKILIHLIL